MQITPGRYAATAFIRVPQAPKGNATVSLQMTPLDDEGKNLPSISTTMRATACDWTRLTVAGAIPAQPGGQPPKRVRLIVIVDGFQPDEEVHIDDVAMFRIN